ncbi:odorant receptor 43a isoform X3 [Ooceraea biroi]|uniref:odorant receptor 43a isoform X3 n=1 Tax=Ooceraea biroi TaxID=2015173 RepID=UPI0005BDF009|nr:odorant receptor 43a isoform X3 [Ooceraea biroi]
MDDSNYSGRKGFEWAVKLNRTSLNLIGVWPDPEENSREKLMSNIRVIITFLVVISLLVPCIHSLIKTHSDIMLTIDNLQITVPVMSTIIKLPIFWRKKKVFHICGQLNIMRNRLTCNHDNFRTVLRATVMYHIRLLRVINTIEDTYNVILLILFLYFGIIFTFCGFLLVALFEDEGNDISFTRLSFLFLTIISITTHMGIYCAVDETLMTQYNGIYHAVYDYEWYSLDPKEAKDLIPFMIKIRDPVYFTAGKIFPVTMAMLCNVIKTAAGYISVLLTLRKN